jgi:VanZ family protein
LLTHDIVSSPNLIADKFLLGDEQAKDWLLMTPLARNIWILWAVVLVAVAIGSLLPKFGAGDKYEVDKFIHAGAYLLLALLPALNVQRLQSALLAFLLLILASGLIELLQGEIPGQQSSLADLAANAAGAAIGLMLGRVLRRKILEWHSRRSEQGAKA